MAKTANVETKKTAKKPAKTAVKAVAKKAAAPKPAAVKETAQKKTVQEKVASVVHGLVATVVDTDGKASGKLTLPESLFGEKINKQLMAQAVRVYLANQREGGANTKTRGEVEGSTRKIYRQKGTGRARHGSIRAHIFVGGGVAFGPVSHEFSRTMPVKMKRLALASALTSQYKEGNIVIVNGLETKAPKTKDMAKALASVSDLSSTLLVLADHAELVVRAARNIEGVTLQPAHNLTTYDVLSHKKIVFMKDAVSGLEKHLAAK